MGVGDQLFIGAAKTGTRGTTGMHSRPCDEVP